MDLALKLGVINAHPCTCRDAFDLCCAGPGNALGIAESLSYITLALGALVLTLQVGPWALAPNGHVYSPLVPSLTPRCSA